MHLKLGGCADLSRGSILEDKYKRRKSSRLGKLRTKPGKEETEPEEGQTDAAEWDKRNTEEDKAERSEGEE